MFVFSFAVSLAEQKAKGDVKRKGRLDPYAYVPLNRTKLNRRYDSPQAAHRAGCSPGRFFWFFPIVCVCM